MEKKELSSEQIEELVNLLNQFSNWLQKNDIIDKGSTIVSTFDFPFENSDWVMKVDEKKNSVSFNTDLIRIVSFEYLKLVFIHEYFHLIVQTVPSKDNVTKIKDDFGGELMKLIDIEADYYSASFFKENHNWDLNKYLKVYFIGRNAFIDTWIRPGKFERFIGSMLSIIKLFKDSEPKYTLFLPTIGPIYTEESIRIIVFNEKNVYFKNVQASNGLITEWKELYNNQEIEEGEYVKRFNDLYDKYHSSN